MSDFTDGQIVFVAAPSGVHECKYQLETDKGHRCIHRYGMPMYVKRQDIWPTREQAVQRQIAQLDARIANLQKRRAKLAPVKEYIEGELV